MQGVDTGINDELAELRAAIRATVMQRDRLKAAMECWYDTHVGKRFPQKRELASLDEKLSGLDSRFKQLWDARHSRGVWCNK